MRSTFLFLRSSIAALACALLGAGCAGRFGSPESALGPALRLETEGLAVWSEGCRPRLEPELLLRAAQIAREVCGAVLGRAPAPLGERVPIVIRSDAAHQRLSLERGAAESFGFYLPGERPEISITAACWKVERNRHRVTRDLPLDALPFVPYGIIAHELTHAYLDAAGYRAARAEIYPWATYQLVVERLRAEQTGLGVALGMDPEVGEVAAAPGG